MAGDWDGDGDVDLVVGNFGANDVTILKNDGAGVFTLAGRITGQIGPKALARGDWDADGGLDLAVANFGANSITVLKNDGTAVFRVFRTLAGFDGASALVSGDWDDDGDLDLAVANFGGNTVVILKNDGSGIFTAASTLPGMIGDRALIVGDWDNDGDLDLAVGNSGANTVVILKNDVRLCKGAYKEPPEKAFPKKADVDANYDLLAKILIDATLTEGSSESRDGRIPPIPAIATHDEKRIEFSKSYASKVGLPKESIEFQMLYGIRRDLQEELAKEGYPVRVYVPFGTHWYPYYVRRLAERPANVWFFVSNFFRK